MWGWPPGQGRTSCGGKHPNPSTSIIKFRNWFPRQPNSGTNFWNSSTNHKSQTYNNPPTFQHLHSTTILPPVPTPLLSCSSPSPHEWTHRPILNFPPEQDQDLLHQFLLALWLFDTWLVSKFQCCPWMSWKLLWIRKGWTANPPDRPDNQRANPMFPNDDCT